MKNLIIGIIIGCLLGGGIAWAGMEIYLVSQNGAPIGTVANPLIIKGQ